MDYKLLVFRDLDFRIVDKESWTFIKQDLGK